MSSYLTLSFDSPELIIWSICIGFNVAIIISYIIKTVEGGFISRLLSSGACDDATSLTLSDLGQDSNKLLKLFLRDGSTLRDIVSLVGNELPTEKDGKGRDNPVFDQARFYISEKNADKAASLGKGLLKWYFLPIYGCLSVIITIIVIELLPILTNI